MFEGFERQRVPTSETEIHLRIGGSGPPVLLVHGYPQTHVTWHKVAPRLAHHFTVVVPDLRGYEDSAAPEPDEYHHAYSKRAMALDMVEVMRTLGFERFCPRGRTRAGGCRASPSRPQEPYPEHGDASLKRLVKGEVRPLTSRPSFPRGWLDLIAQGSLREVLHPSLRAVRGEAELAGA